MKPIWLSKKNIIIFTCKNPAEEVLWLRSKLYITLTDGTNQQN